MTEEGPVESCAALTRPALCQPRGIIPSLPIYFTNDIFLVIV